MAKEKKRKRKTRKGSAKNRPANRRGTEKPSTEGATRPAEKRASTRTAKRAAKKRATKKVKRAAKKRQDADVEVQLAPVVELLHAHITEALCEEVFRDLRTSERQRKWSLFALSRFWLAVILDPPQSLTDILERTRRIDPRGMLPQVEASAQAFFDRAKSLSSAFFAQIYSRFVEKVLLTAPKRYCPEVAHLDKAFASIVAIDGSRLDKIAHRLKILRDVKAAVLPGCLLAVYDLRRGFARQLWFDSDAAASEFERARLAIECLEPNTLVLGDRLYCSPKLIRFLSERECFAVFRRTKNVKVERNRRLGRWKCEDGGVLEDWLATAGTGKDAVDVRLIRLTRDEKTYDVVTSVLDPDRLSAMDVATLYPLRWRVERLFHQLKVVLNLKRFYCANPNAVAQQVYAAALVHAAFRIAQADVADRVDLDPDDLSPDKLFPRLALASITVIEAEYYFELTCRANPRANLRKPDWRGLPNTVVLLSQIRVQRRSSVRKKRDYDEERRRWKSFAAIEGVEE